MNDKAIFKTAMLAGEIMAGSGAETFRVEDTMIRILKLSGLAGVEVYVTTTGIMATLSDPEIVPITEVKRIHNRMSNLSRISDVNQISRNLCDGKSSVEEAYTELIRIRDENIYSRRMVAVATIISTGGFTGLFGGTLTDCLVASLNGLIIVLVGKLLLHRIGSSFMIDAAKSFCIAFFTMLCTLILKNANQDVIIIGSIMPLVPGIPITNAIRDTLQGDYMSGTARAVEAFVVSAGITVGIGLGLGFFHLAERMLML